MTGKKYSIDSTLTYTEEETKATLYRYRLPTLIEREIYPFMQRARDRAWRLGRVHWEWNQLLNDYDLIEILAPRDHLKTFFCVESYALAQAVLVPETTIKIFSKSDRGAIKSLDNIKRYGKYPYFKSQFEKASLDNRTELQLPNGSKIEAAGFFSNQRGGHYDIMIFDDIIDAQVIYSDGVNEKTKTRMAMEILPMAEPETKIIIVGTIQRDDDLYSTKWDEVLSGEHKAVRRVYDAIVDEDKHLTLYPEKWDWESLMVKKKQITEMSGERFFLKEYRNQTAGMVGEIIKPQWKKTYTQLPHVKNEKGEVTAKRLEVYTGWDLSVGKDPTKGDYTAKATIAYDFETRDIYLLSVYQERIDFPNRLRAIGSHAELEKPLKVAIEDNVFQADTVQTAKANINVPIVGVTTIRNKVEKYHHELAPIVEAGRLHIKEGDPMQEKFWQQLTALPASAHDDMADAFCNALKLLPIARKASDYVMIIK